MISVNTIEIPPSPRFIRVALDENGEEILYSDGEIVLSSHAVSDGILEWCEQNEVSAVLLWSGYWYWYNEGRGIRSVWGIKDDAQRVYFSLRWA